MIDRPFRAAPGNVLKIEALGELAAVYDRRSAQTHVLAAPLPEILHAMDDEQCDARGLAKRLAAEFDLGAEGDAVALIAERLSELLAMGLVETA